MSLRVKNTLIILIASIVLVLGGLFILGHHNMPMASNSHSDCNASCKIACFNQAISGTVATPTLSTNLLFVLSFVVAFVVVAFSLKNQMVKQEAFRYSLGPPLYKQLESYRI